MSLSLSELIAALPADAIEGEASGEEALQSFLQRISDRPVPVSATSRLWALGNLQARVAVAYLAYWIRSGFASADENERRLNETHLSGAIRLLGGMSYLRGAIMKVGQALANYPHIVPDEFVDVLSRLHFEAPPMHYSLLREHARNELGDDPENIFATFDTNAFAAASLGQVHRATLKTGERVAVKIQYPNISRTIRSDFRSLAGLMWPMRLSKDWDNIREQFDDLRRTVEQEADYEREARFMIRSRALFHDGEEIVVPRVFEAYSTPRVLTAEYLEGVHAPAFVASNPSPVQRDRAGELVLRTSFRIYYAGRFIYADPHPGNFLFMPDGRLGLIDFGCCREFSDSEWHYQREVDRGYHEGGEMLRQALARAAAQESADELSEDGLRALETMTHWLWEPLDHAGAFDFRSSDYMERGVRVYEDIVRARQWKSQPVNQWITRSFLGFRAMMYRLGARVDVGAIYREESR